MDTIPLYREIRLTPVEVELWDWAVDPMLEFWADAEDREYDGDRCYGEPIALAVNGVGRIVNDPSVADDLIYRVETQMGQMSIEHGGFDQHGRADADRMHGLRCVVAGKKLAGKVRAVFGLEYV